MVGVFVSVGGTGVWEIMPTAQRTDTEGAQADNRNTRTIYKKKFWIFFNLKLHA